MLYCQKCFHVSPDGSMFCDRCGTSLLVNPDDAMPVPITPTQTPPQLHHSSPTPVMPLPVIRDSEPDPSGESQAQRTVKIPRIRLRLSTGKTFQLSGKTEYLIGRRDEKESIYPDVDLADYQGAANGVSRRHARITVDETGVYIEDLESRNETIRNGYRLLAFQRYPLQDGDDLKLGNTVLLVVIS